MSESRENFFSLPVEVAFANEKEFAVDCDRTKALGDLPENFIKVITKVKDPYGKILGMRTEVSYPPNKRDVSELAYRFRQSLVNDAYISFRFIYLDTPAGQKLKKQIEALKRNKVSFGLNLNFYQFGGEWEFHPDVLIADLHLEQCK